MDFRGLLLSYAELDEFLEEDRKLIKQNPTNTKPINCHDKECLAKAVNLQSDGTLVNSSWGQLMNITDLNLRSFTVEELGDFCVPVSLMVSR